MPQTVYRVCALLGQTLLGVPVGTSLDLFTILFAVMSGRLLLFRGAIFPTLAHMDLDAPSVRRTEAALERGHFVSQKLFDNWRKLVEQEHRFEPRSYEGVQPVACDLVGFFRIRLASATNTHYDGKSVKRLPAVVFALVAKVGSVGRTRLAIPDLVLRADAHERDEDLSRRAVVAAKEIVGPEEALILDAGFSLADILAAGLNGFVARLPKNFTARRAQLPLYKGRGARPKRGLLVRPLPRRYRGNLLNADEPDKTISFSDGKNRVRASEFGNLVLPDAKPGAATFRLVVFYHPRYKEPLVLATNLKVSCEALFYLYRDRWPIEQAPLAAKQMLGADRSFVFGAASRFRVPELALLAGSMLSYIAATSQPVATGFWDRCARPTCGRLRRVLFGVNFADLPIPVGQLCKKNSVTAHLPKGAEAHRRFKTGSVPPTAAAFSGN